MALLSKMLILSILELMPDLRNGHSFSFNLGVSGVWCLFDEFLTESADRCRIIILAVFALLSLEPHFHHFVPFRIFCVSSHLLSQLLRNHLMILIIWRKVFPIQNPNSGISTKSQLSLISEWCKMYLSRIYLT
jgi:hypothetical protein